MTTNRTTTALLVVVAVLLGHRASAQPDKCFDFDDELPSADADIEYGSFIGLPETVAFSISGGLLIQTTIIADADGPSGYFYREYPNMGGDFDPALPLHIETRLRVTGITGFGGVWFGALDGERDYQVRFSAEGPHVNTSEGWILVDGAPDVFSFHTYRLESPANDSSFTLYIDDTPFFTGIAAAAGSLNAFRWGGGFAAGSSSGDAEWDFARFCQADAPCPQCQADIDGDDNVGIGDLLIVLAQWGPCPPECFADIDGDGTVGILDLLNLLGAWGPCE